jgi:predicted Zn-dependent peptidase
MGDLIDVVTRELGRSANDKPDAREVERAKAQLKAGLLISLESSSARAEQMARQLLVYDRLLTPRELIERVDAVTPDRVCAFAQRMVGSSRPVCSVVGAGKRSQHWAELASRQLTA